MTFLLVGLIIIFPTRPKEKYEAGVLVEGRNEPCTLVQVLEVVAKLRNRDPLELVEQVYANTEALFYRMREEAKYKKIKRRNVLF